MKKLLFLMLLLLSSTALAEQIMLPAGNHQAGESFAPGYWYIQPAEGEIVLITYSIPGQEKQSLILTGLNQPFAGDKVTTAINLALPAGSTFQVYGGAVLLQPGQEALVFASKSGSKYHRIADCSGMKNPVAMTEAEALSSGRSACSNCCR